jgi:hypothetical protein
MVSDGSVRRRHIRLTPDMTVEWSPLSAGEAGPAHTSPALDLSAGGLSVPHNEELPVGTYLRLALLPTFAPALPDLEGVVAYVAPPSDQAAGYSLGVRFVSPPQDELHALLFAAYEHIGEYACVCTAVRHCGDMRNACPAHVKNQNCWQVAVAPCCHWRSNKDCVRCPVSFLAFLA